MKTMLKNVAIVVLAIVSFSCEQETIETTLQENAKPQTEETLLSKAQYVVDINQSFIDNRISNNGFVFINQGGCASINWRIVKGTGFIVNNFWYILQTDGNFVCYNLNKGPGDPDSHPVWATGTENKGVEYIYIQEDANVVAYSKDFKVIWDSKTSVPTCNRFKYWAITAKGNINLSTLSNSGPGFRTSVDMPVTYPANY